MVGIILEMVTRVGAHTSMELVDNVVEKWHKWESTNIGGKSRRVATDTHAQVVTCIVAT